jgi:hypothetical protein
MALKLKQFLSPASLLGTSRVEELYLGTSPYKLNTRLQMALKLKHIFVSRSL